MASTCELRTITGSRNQAFVGEPVVIEGTVAGGNNLTAKVKGSKSKGTDHIVVIAIIAILIG